MSFSLNTLGETKSVDLNKVFDVAIIGTGPAGYSAAIYAARYGLSSIVIGASHGGTITDTNMVENYPGFKMISGQELMNKFKEHAEKYDVPIVEDSVIKITKEDKAYTLETSSGKHIKAKSLIFATGTKRRELNVPGEKEFKNKGVSYCSICDGPFFKDKIVGVVGGGDGAASSAVQLTQYASKVYIFVRGEKLKAEPYWQNLIAKEPKIEILTNVEVKEIFGDDKVKGVMLSNGNKVELDGLFVEIGSVPNSSLAKSIGVNINDYGYIIVNEKMETNIPGVYAAGDVTSLLTHFRQVIVAAAQGAIAANSAYHFSKEEK